MLLNPIFQISNLEIWKSVNSIQILFGIIDLKKNWILLPKIGKIVELIIREIDIINGKISFSPFLPKKTTLPNKIHIHAALELVNMVHKINPKENRKVIILFNLLFLEFIVSAKQNGKIKFSHKPV